MSIVVEDVRLLPVFLDKTNMKTVDRSQEPTLEPSQTLFSQIVAISISHVFSDLELYEIWTDPRSQSRIVWWFWISIGLTLMSGEFAIQKRTEYLWM